MLDILPLPFSASCPQVDKSQLEKAHYLLRPFMLRRLKEEVEVRLPPKVRMRGPGGELRRLHLVCTRALTQQARTAYLIATRYLHSLHGVWHVV